MEHRFLGEICCPKQWKTISTSELTETGYPVYGANGIIGKYKEYNHEKATILVTCRGATCGSVVISKPYSYVNGNAMALDNLDDDICIDYLYFYLIGRGFADVISGSAQPQIIRSTIEKIRIPLYNFEKQKQIASVFSTINGMKLKFELLIEKYDQLVKARFVEMFGSVHDSVYYPYLPVGNFTKVISGGTPNRKKDEYWKRGNIPWIKTTELQNDVIKKTEECITEVGLKESSAKIVPIGTVLVAMYGQGKTRGKTAYLDIEACTNQACACILPSQNVNSKYLWKYFELSYEKLRSLAQGAGQPNLNGNMIKDFPVLIPPINMQNDYVSFVEQVDKSKLAVQQSLEKTQLLFDSLMQEYFGEN